MPPRKRATKVAKVLKENIITDENKIKSKNAGKATKVQRKPLADKTNSASDDNASVEVTKAPLKKATNDAESNPQTENHVRIRRERRAPSRFIENHVFKSISIVQESLVNTKKKNHVVLTTAQKTKKKSGTKSPLKTPQKDKESSIVANRPKRIHRLPSRFDDHSISPNKFIPVLPCFASTPIAKQKQPLNETCSKQVSSNSTASECITTPETTPNKKVVKNAPVQKLAKTTLVKKVVKNTRTKKETKTSPVRKARDAKTTAKKESPCILDAKAASDTNNNPRHEMSIQKNTNENNISSLEKNKSPELARNKNKRLINTSFSFRVLEEKKSSPKRAEEKLAVYDFTYDPSEEPPPQKKKRKRTVKKKAPPKPKVVIVKNNYDTNISKTLTSLKQALNKANIPMKIQPSSSSQKPEQPMQTLIKQSVASSTATITSDKVVANSAQDIEDAPVNAMDFNDHIDYSPVTSPNHTPRQQVKMSAVNETRDQLYFRARSTMRPENVHKDPLNLIGELSFFDEEPVASSSMNHSVRDPLSTPWRVEYTDLPIKWPVNAHIKANMTPAVESSFISTHENKKHVYTNMVPQSNDFLPEIVANDTNTTNLKQTTIIDCIREVALRSANKKKTKVTPNKTIQSAQHTPKKQPTPNKSNGSSYSDNATSHNVTPDPASFNTSKKLTPSDQENSVENRTPIKRKSNSLENITPAKIPCVKEPNVDNCFGFDDSENQENVSPRKKDCIRSLRPRSRAVLKELNAITGPLRAKVPVAAKTKFAANSDIVNKLFDGMKSAADAPELPEKNNEMEAEISSVSDPSWHENMEANNEESVHLFEDINLVHNLKSQRRSYGKAKKVTFCQKSTLNTETQLGVPDSEDDEGDSDDADNLDDVSFKMPATKTKKVTKKKKKGPKLSKKEEEEVEAWAAAFNSMCEDVEEFPLVLE